MRALFDLEPTEVESDYDRAFHAVGRHKRALVVLFTDLVDDGAARTLVSPPCPVLARRHAVLVASLPRPRPTAAVSRAPPDDVRSTSCAPRSPSTCSRAGAGPWPSCGRWGLGGRGAAGAPSGPACVHAYLDLKQRARICRHVLPLSRGRRRRAAATDHMAQKLPASGSPTARAGAGGRSQGVMNPSVSPATTRKIIDASMQAPMTGTRRPSASARVRRPGSMSARAMARPPRRPRRCTTAPSRPWGTMRRTNCVEPARPPLEGAEHPEEGAVVGQGVHREQAEGEASGEGQERHLDVVDEDLHGQSAPAHDRDPVEGAPPGCAEAWKPDGSRPEADAGSASAHRRPERHEAEEEPGRYREAAVQFPDPPPDPYAQVLPGGVLASGLGVDDGVGVCHKGLEAEGTRGVRPSPSRDGQVCDRRPVEGAEAVDLVGCELAPLSPRPLHEAFELGPVVPPFNRELLESHVPPQPLFAPPGDIRRTVIRWTSKIGT